MLTQHGAFAVPLLVRDDRDRNWDGIWSVGLFYNISVDGTQHVALGVVKSLFLVLRRHRC